MAMSTNKKYLHSSRPHVIQDAMSASLLTFKRETFIDNLTAVHFSNALDITAMTCFSKCYKIQTKLL